MADATITRGDYERITFTVKNGDGSTRNISTDTITFTAKPNLRAGTVAWVTKVSTDSAQINKTNAAAGQGEVIINPADFASVTQDGQEFYCDIQVTDSSSHPYSTRFTLAVILDVSA